MYHIQAIIQLTDVTVFTAIFDVLGFKDQTDCYHYIKEGSSLLTVFKEWLGVAGAKLNILYQTHSSINLSCVLMNHA